MLEPADTYMALFLMLILEAFAQEAQARRGIGRVEGGGEFHRANQASGRHGEGYHLLLT